MKIFILSIFLALPTLCLATDYIAVGTAKAKKPLVALQSDLVEENMRAVAKEVTTTVDRNLKYLSAFELLAEPAFSDLAKNSTPGSFSFEGWKTLKTDFLFKYKVKKEPDGFSVSGTLFSVSNEKAILAKIWSAKIADAKKLAHTVSDDLVYAITGDKGIFRSKIVAVCDRTAKKELYLMDFDGSNLLQLTKHHSLTLSPAFSPKGDRIAYSLIAKNRKNIKNTNLYELDLKTKSVKLLSDRIGINSGANYHPDGSRIALTMSFLGNPEIFVFDPRDRSVSRLTKNGAIDVDPNFSPTGKELSFVSNRDGKSMIYKMNADGKNVERLTFAGEYNATPAWSPTGKKIVFAGWVDKKFDLFLMNSDGTQLERLTKNQGNNEDPSFSPDGNFIVFSSTRSDGKTKNLYTMAIDGTQEKRLTYGAGSCVSPRWTNTN